MMTKWQPIETAPRDGTEILCFDKYCVVMHWHELCKMWFTDDGNTGEPTHWMLLPEAPKTEE
jgi:hypothetical protein